MPGHVTEASVVCHQCCTQAATGQFKQLMPALGVLSKFITDRPKLFNGFAGIQSLLTDPKLGLPGLFSKAFNTAGTSAGAPLAQPQALLCAAALMCLMCRCLLPSCTTGFLVTNPADALLKQAQLVRLP